MSILFALLLAAAPTEQPTAASVTDRSQHAQHQKHAQHMSEMQKHHEHCRDMMAMMHKNMKHDGHAPSDAKGAAVHRGNDGN